MNIQRNQKTQFIILFSLVAVVVTLGIYRFVGQDAETPPNADARQVEAKADEPVEDDSTTADVAVDSQPDLPMVASSGGEQSRDPFAVQIGSKKEPSAPNLKVNSGGSPPIFRAEPIPPIMGFGGPGQIPGVSVGTPNVEESMPQLQLTGVVEGPISVAIIRGPDDARYIVREGQVIDGRYRVDSISRVGVRLKYKDKSLILRLGESSTG